MRRSLASRNAWRAGGRENACAKRVFLATLDARLIALDFATGQRCADFGTRGEVNLLDGIEHLVDDWEFNVTSPPTVIGNVVVVAASLADEMRRIQPSGAVRAFDARSGKLLWGFNTIPKPGEFGLDTWQNYSAGIHSGANVWSTITADEQRGLVFLPVSTAGPDFIGIDRPGANLFVDSIVALKAAMGERVWHFQTTHHDLWDYDLAAPPLVTGGGLIFHAGTKELVLRAHYTDTGAVLASFDIPAGLHAGPNTYKFQPNGKQYLVIAPGGHKRMDSKLGDYIIAYTLP